VIPTAVAGLLVLPLVPWIIRGFARADAAAARWGLSPSKTDALEERVDTLRHTQARSVDIAMADRRQIERDLHDGAQQRLLSLGMDLGMALEKFGSDPDAARALVGGAHEEVQRAIVELRNLARGIHPAVSHRPGARRGAVGTRGAKEEPGGGIAGLADRASSVEGSLSVSSPAGGPTVIAAELPCAS
jgi:signal transduction histidine kinase